MSDLTIEAIEQRYHNADAAIIPIAQLVTRLKTTYETDVGFLLGKLKEKQQMIEALERALETYRRQETEG